MSKLTKKTQIRIQVTRGCDVLITRDLGVRNHADLEIGIADTLRQHRLQTHEADLLCGSAITVSRVDSA